MAQPTAAHRVFAIPELLENILLHLPPVDLLLATRINKTFLSTIDNSPRIQKSLFLQPDRTPRHTPKLNPFLLKIFPEHILAQYFDRSLCHGRHRQGKPVHLPTWRYDDLLMTGKTCKMPYLSADGDVFTVLSEIVQDQNCYLHLPMMDLEDWDAMRPAVRFPEANWRAMFATSPPIGIHVVENHPRHHRVQMGGLELGAVLPVLFETGISKRLRREEWERRRYGVVMEW